MVGAAAGVTRKQAKVLHGAVLPEKSVRARAGVRHADNCTRIIDAVRFTGCAAQRAQILNAAAGPQSRMAAGTAHDLALIVDSKR